MALCLNPQCHKTVPNDSNFCAYCGGKSISKVQSFGSADQIPEEITIENFEKVVRSTPPAQDRVTVPIIGKGSMKSKFAVRMQYIKRKLFSRRNS
jgi:hypothetical protein